MDHFYIIYPIPSVYRQFPEHAVLCRNPIVVRSANLFRGFGDDIWRNERLFP